MNLPNLKIYLLILTICASLASCSDKKHEATATSSSRLEVTAGIPPLETMVKEIGGDSVNVTCLMGAGTDPESFDPGASALRSAAESRIYFAIGSLPFEEQLTKGLKENNRQIDIINLAGEVDPLYGTHGEDADPHIWLSVRNARNMAKKIFDALSEARPTARGYFENRLRIMEGRLDSLDNAFSQALAPRHGGTFIIGHPSLTYMARDYGLRQIALTPGHKENSALSMRQRLDDAAASSPLAIFTQPGPDGRMTAEAAERLGIPATRFNPMSPDWEKQLSTAVAALSASK